MLAAPTFPLFALFDPALGMTTVVPDMDFRKPAQVDPSLLIEAIEDWGCTNMFGSPALLNTFGRYGEQHGVKLPTMRRLRLHGAWLWNCKGGWPQEQTTRVAAARSAVSRRCVV